MIRKWKETRNSPSGQSFSLKEVKDPAEIAKLKSVYQNWKGRNIENVTIEEESDSMESSA